MPDATPDAFVADAFVPGNDPGSGTNTLLLDGTATAEPSVPDTSDATNFATTFTARVTRSGVDVTDGTVQISSTAGTVSLLFDTTTMRWRGAQAGYFEAYTIDVTSGTDNVLGARVDGPDIHVITAPTLGATVDSLMPLMLTWSRTQVAETATVQTRQINPLTITDNGTYSLAMGSLKSKPDQTENETIDIVRSSLIAPAGAVVGSSFRVAIRNSVDVLVQPTQ